MHKNIAILGICALLVAVVILGTQVTLFNHWIITEDLVGSELQPCNTVLDCVAINLACGCDCNVWAVAKENQARYQLAREQYCLNVGESEPEQAPCEYCPLMDIGVYDHIGGGLVCIDSQCQIRSPSGGSIH